MEIKRIQCPVCKAVLEVKNSTGVAERLITCPMCKSQLKVRFHPQAQQEPLEAHTVLGGARRESCETQLGSIGSEKTQLGSGSSETQLLGGSSPAAHRQRTPVLMLNGREYPLKTGKNVIGRKANSSTANIQIDTNDRSMSREHSTIDVTVFSGQDIKAVLRNDKNKNPTYVNGQVMAPIDAIILSSGCTIKMGQTILTYKEI